MAGQTVVGSLFDCMVLRCQIVTELLRTQPLGLGILQEVSEAFRIGKP